MSVVVSVISSQSLTKLPFHRLVNIYGFERITVGTEIGSYTHHLLVRGKPNICRFMVRTKVKNKGSKTTASASMATNLSPIRSSRRVSMTSPENPKTTPQMVRSASCPVAVASSSINPSINANISGIANESFQIDIDPIQTHCVSRDASNASRDISLRSKAEEFSDDLFSNDAFDSNFNSDASRNGGALVSVDGMGNTNTNTKQRNDLPSILVCEDNIQDDITDLGNSSRSHTTQASGMLFHQNQAQSDPFQPKPIPEHQLPLQNQHCQQQQQRQQQMMQEQMHQQRQEQECQMLQMQIRVLQNQIAQQRRNSSNNGNNSNPNYLCNGVAAIGPGDHYRGSNILPHEENQQGFLLDPTPIYTPAMQPNANMRRTISFGSFPQMM